MSRHSDFGFWSPQDRDRWGGRPVVGDLVAWDFKPWRVVDIREDTRERPNDPPGQKFCIWVLRPDGAAEDLPMKEHMHLRGTDYMYLDKINEHYGLCVHCQELLPCRAMMSARAAKRASEEMERYETPGVCPACQEPVTHRQGHEVFPNVVVPLGERVTFHTRKQCRSSMESYRKRCSIPPSQLRLDGGHLG